MTPSRRIAIALAVILVVAGTWTTAFALVPCDGLGCWDDDCVPEANACQNNFCKCDNVPQCPYSCTDVGECNTGTGNGDTIHHSECHNINGGLGYCFACPGPVCDPGEGNDCTRYNACGMPGSGGTIQCDGSCSAGAAPPNSLCNKDPIGSFDVADCTAAMGWLFDPDYSGSTNVHIYRDGPAGVGVLAGIVPTGGSRPDVQAWAAGAGYAPPNRTNSGWSWTIPAALKNGVAHSLYAYGINVNSGGVASGPNPLLWSNPKSITCNDPPAGSLTTATCGSATGSATDAQGSPVQVVIYDGIAGSGGTQIGVGSANSGFTIGFTPFTNGQTHNIYAYAQDIPAGTWQQLTGTTPVTCGPTVTLSANPTTVTFGGASTLTWSVSNATNCVANPGGWFNASSLFNGVANSSGSSGPLINATTFTLTCTNAAGQSVNATANVAVNIPPPTASIVNITDTNYCTGGAGMNITWAAEGPARPIKHYQVQVLDSGGSVVFDTGQTVYAQAPSAPSVAVGAAAPQRGFSRLLGQFVAAISSFIR